MGIDELGFERRVLAFITDEPDKNRGRRVIRNTPEVLSEVLSDDPNTPGGSIVDVVHALDALQDAGLVEARADATWAVTDAGRGFLGGVVYAESDPGDFPAFFTDAE